MVSRFRERKLVRALRARDEKAFTDLVRQYQHKVFNMTYRMLGSREEAEDVAQEVFVTVFRHIDQFRGEAKFSTWLYRIATNHARNRIKYLSRRKQRQHQQLEDTPDGAMLDSPMSNLNSRPDQAVFALELEEMINDGLRVLSEEHREILVLRDIENLSYSEIGEIVGLAEGTVKSRLFRARAALKQYIQSRYQDP